MCGERQSATNEQAEPRLHACSPLQGQSKVALQNQSGAADGDHPQGIRLERIELLTLDLQILHRGARRQREPRHLSPGRQIQHHDLPAAGAHITRHPIRRHRRRLTTTDTGTKAALRRAGSSKIS